MINSHHRQERERNAGRLVWKLTTQSFHPKVTQNESVKKEQNTVELFMKSDKIFIDVYMIKIIGVH